jgi:glycosyltransferase involved in cell wall biosynthesis
VRVAFINLTNGRGISGGAVKYTKRVVPLLRDSGAIHQLWAFSHPRTAPQFADAPSLEMEYWPDNDVARHFAWLRRRVRELSPDVAFIAAGRWVDFGLPTVVMIRNMEPFLCPIAGNPMLEGARNLLRLADSVRAAWRATHVIAVSKLVNESITRLTVKPAKVSVIYHGVDAPDESDAGDEPAALRGRDVSRGFLFTVGSIRPARGLEDAIVAMGSLRQRGVALPLVIAGGQDPGMAAHRNHLESLAAEHSVSDRIFWTGKLKPAEVRWCFGHCTAFLMTSRAEACPNTALEAMSHGCQIISSSQPPMPEFFGSNALYYEPWHCVALADRVRDVLAQSHGETTERRAQIRRRASDFRWSDTAAATIRVLQLASRQNPRA